MSWKDILKNEMPINELIDEVANELDEFLNSKLVISEGEYEEEFEGYRDAGEDSLFLNYPNVSGLSLEIRIVPTDTHEDDDDITTAFDLEMDNLRLGSYTGKEGHYLAAEDWEESDRPILEQIRTALTGTPSYR
tara:strand:+ start:312 stop:713 length:402 start_codon:yes stop_codon:yes gene_type:complete